MSEHKVAVVAIGGNALITSAEKSEAHHEYEAIVQAARQIVELIACGWRVVVTHGNGPQVGFILRRSEIAQDEVPTIPLEVAVGQTQGAIGYMLQHALNNELTLRGITHTRAVAIVTQALVDLNDPAFQKPDKPIGAYMDKATAEKLAASQGWSIAEETGKGWRRVVASPKPLQLLESSVIRQLLDRNVLVIACGGGGIPVAYNDHQLLQPVPAVIDKDRASALLAIELQADMLLVPTGIEQVAVNFGTPRQRWLTRLTPAEAETLLQEGQFGAGSMGPKIEAMLTYLQHCPQGAGLITSLHAMDKAVHGQGGTHFTNGSE